jgi:hypothetical protein
VDQFTHEDISSLLELGFPPLNMCPLSDRSTERTIRDGDRFERLQRSLETSRGAQGLRDGLGSRSTPKT